MEGDGHSPPRSGKPVTARQLARRLGVSQSTISRAYSQHASISPAMRVMRDSV